MLKELLFEWLPWILNTTRVILDSSKRVALAAYTEATVQKEWVFLKSIAVPVFSTCFPSIPDDQIQWRVKCNPIRFLGFPSNEFKHISYLGFTIHLPDGTVCELTDWINDVKWSGLEQPSAHELFTLWCCEMGKPYFPMILMARFEIITENGETLTL